MNNNKMIIGEADNATTSDEKKNLQSFLDQERFPVLESRFGLADTLRWMTGQKKREDMFSDTESDSGISHSESEDKDEKKNDTTHAINKQKNDNNDTENSDDDKNSPKSHDKSEKPKHQKQVETGVKTKIHVHKDKHQKDSTNRSKTKTKKEQIERSEKKKKELQFLSDIRPNKQPMRNNIKMIENLIRNQQTSIQNDKVLKDELMNNKSGQDNTQSSNEDHVVELLSKRIIYSEDFINNLKEQLTTKTDKFATVNQIQSDMKTLLDDLRRHETNANYIMQADKDDNTKQVPGVHDQNPNYEKEMQNCNASIVAMLKVIEDLKNHSLENGGMKKHEHNEPHLLHNESQPKFQDHMQDETQSQECPNSYTSHTPRPVSVYAGYSPQIQFAATTLLPHTLSAVNTPRPVSVYEGYSPQIQFADTTLSPHTLSPLDTPTPTSSRSSTTCRDTQFPIQGPNFLQNKEVQSHTPTPITQFPIQGQNISPNEAVQSYTPKTTSSTSSTTFRDTQIPIEEQTFLPAKISSFQQAIPNPSFMKPTVQSTTAEHFLNQERVLDDPLHNLQTL